MGVKKALALVSTVVAFTFGVVFGYLKGFEEGYNLSAGTPYPAETHEQEDHHEHDEE